MRTQTRRAFTLIELLVVVAIIALLIGILLPSLSGARKASWQIAGASMQRQLALGAQMYATENNDYIPGINSSGLRPYNAGLTGGISAYMDEADRDDTLPTQVYDWVTPSMTDAGLPINRVERMVHIFNKWRDPAMKQTVVPYSGGGPGTTEAVAWANATQKPIYGTSFLMPASFQWCGLTAGPALVDSDGNAIQVNNPFINPFTVPASYKPRLTAIELAGKKVAVADGFRYHDGALIDVDMGVISSSQQHLYQSFTSSGPVFKRSTEYGLPGSLNPSDGAQIPLSYRHGNKMNITCWDMHGETLTIRESHDPIRWYPTGARYTGGDAVSTVAELGYTPGDKLP